MAQAHESDFAHRSGTANESQATAVKYATGGIRESLDSGKPIKVESSNNTINEKNSAMRKKK